MPTFWMLAKRVPQAEYVATSARYAEILIGWRAACQRLVSAYDFALAKPMLSAVGKLGVEGPVLVAWRHPNSAQDAEVLMLDLSDFSHSDFHRAFLIWQDHIAHDLSTWDNGFDLVLIREECRNFIQAYGADIVRIVQKPMPLLSRMFYSR